MSWVIEHLHRDGSVLARVSTRGQELRLGRALDNDLVLDDAHCAAYHAVLRIDGQDQAQLHDLGTLNGLRTRLGFGRSQRHAVVAVQHDQKIELGNTSIRIRHANRALAPEKPLSMRMVWPWSLAALVLVLGHAGWETWLKDVGPTPPSYLPILTWFAVGLLVWSSGYALLGRLLGGGDRLFTHLLIVCAGYVGGELLSQTLHLLAYGFYWLWPLRIGTTVSILVVALIVRAHLRVADPRHWPVTRWAVGLATALAITVPVAQTWINSQRLTHIQLMNLTQHPALRAVEPIGIDRFVADTDALKARIEKQRSLEPTGETIVSNDD